MSYEVYKVIHVAGLMLAFLGLGGSLVAGTPHGNRLASSLHTVGLFAMVVAGFGLLARLEIRWPWPAWVFGKIAIWLVLGAMPVLHKRGIVPTGVAWLLTAVLGAGAAWMAITKPWM